jgi:tRNA (cmo5U34)-methyltransferase
LSALAVHRLVGVGKADLLRVAARLRQGGRSCSATLWYPRIGRRRHINRRRASQPSTVDDQVRWLAAAGSNADVVWARQDLAVIIADSPP